MHRWKHSAAGIILAVLLLVIAGDCSNRFRPFNDCDKYVLYTYGNTAVEKFTYIRPSSCFNEKIALEDALLYRVTVLYELYRKFFHAKEDVVRRFPLVHDYCFGLYMIEHLPIKLEQLLTKTLVTLEEHTYLFYGIVQAVNQIHSYGVVHLDINPDNIRIDVHGTVKLVNFRISEYIDPDEEKKWSQVGVGGTRAYLAPEVLGKTSAATWLKSDNIRNYQKYKVDMWALGATGYKMMTQSYLVNEDMVTIKYECVMEKHHESESIVARFGYLGKPFSWSREEARRSVTIDLIQPKYTHHDLAERRCQESLGDPGQFMRDRSLGLSNPTNVINLYELERILFKKLLVIDPSERATIGEVLKATEHVLRRVDYPQWLKDRQ